MPINKLAPFFLLAVLGPTYANENLSKLKKIQRLDQFAFGSCNQEYKPQPLWKHILKDQPQLFLWGGDNIYADKNPLKGQFEIKYAIQNDNTDYKKLTQKVPIIGIWDDHDYGKNNGGDDYDYKYKSQQLFLDFIKEPANSARRDQEGIYTSYHFGSAKQQVKFILLDNRFHLTSHKTKDARILGEEQWQWLEKELAQSQAQIHFIVTGIPFLPPKMIHTEEWAQYPHEKLRMLNLLKKYRPSGVIFLSGDKHFSAITKSEGYFEIMSSGMTHKTTPLLIPWLKPQFPESYYELNYGLLKIDWQAKPLELSVEIKGEQGTALKKTLKLSTDGFFNE
jgi:alkaline phosphatase D